MNPQPAFVCGPSSKDPQSGLNVNWAELITLFEPKSSFFPLRKLMFHFILESPSKKREEA